MDPGEIYANTLSRFKAAKDTDFIKLLSDPALKLNEAGRKVLLDLARSMAATEDYTTRELKRAAAAFGFTDDNALVSYYGDTPQDSSGIIIKYEQNHD